MRHTVERTISPPRPARLSPCEHGRTTDPIARRTGDPCPKSPRFGFRPCRVGARRGACRTAGPDGPWPVHASRPSIRSDGDDDLQEPNAAGGPLTGPAAAATLQVRGSIYYPANRATGSPVILLVHGNHGSCDTGSAPNCTAFKRNDRGYAYLGENLATWGYTVLSLDQDQLIYYQDGTRQGHAPAPPADGRGAGRALRRATRRRCRPTPTQSAPRSSASSTSRAIGLMGHSRGGDAVSTSSTTTASARAGPRYTCAPSSRSRRSTTSAARPTACRT